MSVYLGLGLLVLIIALRWVVARWRVVRFTRWWKMSQEAIQRRDLVAAEAALRKCAQLVPVASPVHRVLGGVLARRGKLAEAEERLRFGADLEPRNPDGFLDLGFFLALCVPDRPDAAIDAFRQAVTCAPDLRGWLREEQRLEPLRQHPQFRELLEAPK